MERNLQYLLDKSALEEAVIKYCTAVDKLDDLDGMLTNFTEDAVLDLTGLHLPRFVGHEQIRGFFAQVFADMTHHMHLLTNFRVDGWKISVFYEAPTLPMPESVTAVHKRG